MVVRMLTLIIIFISTFLPAQTDSIFTRAKDLYLANRIDAADSLFQMLWNMDENNAEVAFYLGRIAIVREDLDEAATWFERAIEIADTSALSGEFLNEGISSLKQYLAYQPANNEPSWSYAYLRLGQIYEKQGYLELAKKT